MDVDCRRPRHDENYSSLFVENSHPETLHRDMCIACSGSSSGLRLPPLRTMPIHKIVSKERCQSYFIDGCRRIKIERNNLLCGQAPTEVFRSIFAWLVARLTFYLQYLCPIHGQLEGCLQHFRCALTHHHTPKEYFKILIHTSVIIVLISSSVNRHIFVAQSVAIPCVYIQR